MDVSLKALLVLFILIALQQGSLVALRITQVLVPLEVLVGNDVVLRCDYDLEGHKLYSLKWYKGQHEFYRYVPKEVPPTQTFPWSQFIIQADERDKSGSLVAGRVTLKSVSVEAEGTYKCEVSTEAPVFDTDYKEANLTIIDIGDEKPSISTMDTVSLVLRCTMNRTRPASRLDWLINDVQVTAAGAVTRYEPRHEGNVWNTHSDLNVAALVAADLLRPEQQKQQVTCISRVGQKYDRRVNWSALHWSANKSTPSPDNNKTLPTDTLLSKRTQPVVGAHAGTQRSWSSATAAPAGPLMAAVVYSILVYAGAQLCTA